MDLKDALGGWPGDNQQPPHPAWSGQAGGGNGGFWPGGQSEGGGFWPGGQGGGGGPWSGGHSGGGGPWSGGHSGDGGEGPWSRGGQGGGGSQAGGGGRGPWPGPPTQSGQQNLMVPFYQDLPNGVYDKLLITIAGTIKPNPDKITVDLCAGSNIAFHFNPRFNESGRRVIVRNSRFNNQWGGEEREQPLFPFVPGQPFEMKIMCTNSEFKVAVNNSHLLEFKHRNRDLRSIRKLEIHNDLTLTKVQMETMP